MHVVGHLQLLYEILSRSFRRGWYVDFAYFICDLNVLHFSAGHRVATQYLLSALEGSLPAEHLLHYREANSKLPGHPELGLTPGVKFSSGRLGHVWALVNGVALANKDKTVFMLGSDGSQQVRHGV